MTQNGHAPAGAPTWLACPTHGAESLRRSSKFDGWYCAGKVGRRYCDWTHMDGQPERTPDFDTEQAKAPSLGCSLEWKIRTADYETATVWLHLSGLTRETTDDEIAELVERGKLAYQVMGSRLAAEGKAIREQAGW